MNASTILEAFEPPDGKVGHSAVLVAMTGAEDFLEAALVSFTGLKARQRAELGITLAYLMLDPHATSGRTNVFSPSAVPGMYELQPQPVDATSLLHAKLVLMAFAEARTGQPTDLRLAVLTANFTYTCARHQLELAWVVDVPLDGSAPARDRADVAAAAKFVYELIERRYYLDERALPLKQRSLTRRLDVLLSACTENAPERTLPGFIHSLDDPLYPQIQQQMRRQATAGRNLLICGSGFYENPTEGGGKPTVLARLEDLGVLSENVRRIAIAEPKMAGALAPWVRDDNVEGWEVVAAHDPRNAGRTLHAKFIYAAYWRDGFASNGCLYLGSGNLSRRGLGLRARLQKPTGEKQSTSGHDGVNIECGVVFAVPGRLSAEELADRLFWLDDQDELAVGDWEAGTGVEPDDLTLIVASPILSARLDEARLLHLRWHDAVPPTTQLSVRVGTTDWVAIPPNAPTIAVSPHEVATVLHIRDDGVPREWAVPIVDPTGRVCWSPPKFDTYDEARAALLDFPIRPAEAAGDDDDDDDRDGVADPTKTLTEDDHAKTYALHAAAELIEQTAALQRALPPSMLDDWLEHMERCFRASFPESLIATWRDHRIDVFAHLAGADLRPPAMLTKQRTRYDEILTSVATAWGLR